MTSFSVPITHSQGHKWTSLSPELLSHWHLNFNLPQPHIFPTLSHSIIPLRCPISSRPPITEFIHLFNIQQASTTNKALSTGDTALNKPNIIPALLELSLLFPYLSALLSILTSSPVISALAFWPLSCKHHPLLLFHFPSSCLPDTTPPGSIQLSTFSVPASRLLGNTAHSHAKCSPTEKEPSALLKKILLWFHNQFAFLFITTSNLHSLQTQNPPLALPPLLQQMTSQRK